MKIAQLPEIIKPLEHHTRRLTLHAGVPRSAQMTGRGLPRPVNLPVYCVFFSLFDNQLLRDMKALAVQSENVDSCRQRLL